jgi:hypothetical protein
MTQMVKQVSKCKKDAITVGMEPGCSVSFESWANRCCMAATVVEIESGYSVLFGVTNAIEVYSFTT